MARSVVQESWGIVAILLMVPCVYLVARAAFWARDDPTVRPAAALGLVSLIAILAVTWYIARPKRT